DDLLAAVARFRARRVDPQRTPHDIADGLCRLRRAVDALEVEFAREAAAFAATDQYDVEGYVSPVAWLRHECHMTGGAAAGAICVGEQSAGVALCTEALTEGRIGFSHLTLLARTAEAVTASGGRFNQTRLL